MQAVLDALKGGAAMQDANQDAKLRSVLGFSFNSVSPAAQNMVGTNAWCSVWP